MLSTRFSRRATLCTNPSSGRNVDRRPRFTRVPTPGAVHVGRIEGLKSSTARQRFDGQDPQQTSRNCDDTGLGLCHPDRIPSPIDREGHSPACLREHLFRRETTLSPDLRPPFLTGTPLRRQAPPGDPRREPMPSNAHEEQSSSDGVTEFLDFWQHLQLVSEIRIVFTHL
jgi:hypothetical protein